MNHPNNPRKNKDPQFSVNLFSPKNIITWLGVSFLRLLSMLPYKILMRIGNFTGNLIYKVSPHRKEISRTNINRCLDIEGEILEKVVRLNFQAVGRGIFEMALAWWASDYRIKKLDTKLINGDLLRNQEAEGIVDDTDVNEHEQSFSEEALEKEDSQFNGLENFGVKADSPDLFNSSNDNSDSNELLSMNDDESEEEDDLEIPAFLRRQKN
mgnify:CR=1 FL=1